MPAFAASRARTRTLRTAKDIRIVADLLLDNILNGFKQDDYLEYSKDFDPSLKVLGARTKFFNVNRYIKKFLGNYLYREYIGSLQRGNNTLVLWKGVFDKTENDVLIKLVIARKNNRYFVTGLWLQ